jgi:hypothetical protein
MAFELVGITTSETIHETDTLMWDVARMLRLSMPLLERLDKQFYDNPEFSAPDAEKLADEFSLLAQHLRNAPHVAHQAWAARPPAFRTLMITSPPDVDAMVAKVEALARVCREVATHGGILRGESD